MVSLWGISTDLPLGFHNQHMARLQNSHNEEEVILFPAASGYVDGGIFQHADSGSHPTRLHPQHPVQSFLACAILHPATNPTIDG